MGSVLLLQPHMQCDPDQSNAANEKEWSSKNKRLDINLTLDTDEMDQVWRVRGGKQTSKKEIIVIVPANGLLNYW